MKYSEAKQGRVFVMRLEDGEIVHEEIERFARLKQIRAAALMILGGAAGDSRLVVGPDRAAERPIKPLEIVLDHVHEVTGTGTLFSDEKGDPILHMHMACGRNAEAVAGCIRRGVKVWHVMEVILFELVETRAIRAPDPEIGFALLSFHGKKGSIS